MARVAAVIALVSALAVTGAAAAAAPRYGLADDAGKYADNGGGPFFARLRSLGMTENRITVLWYADRPAVVVDAPFLDRALPHAAARGVRVVLHVYPARPLEFASTPTAVDDFARFVERLARRYPQVRQFVIGNEPNQPRFWRPQYTPFGEGAAAAAYSAVLGAAYDALKGVDPGLTVIGMGLSGRGNDSASAASNASRSPVRFLRDLGAAYRASGRAAPLMDELGFHPYPQSDRHSVRVGHRWPRAGMVNLARVKQAVWDAFAGTAQPTVEQGLRLRIDEIGWQVRIPARLRRLYHGRESAAVTTERAQARNYAELVRLAACDPSVSGLYLLYLTDERNLERFQSGLLRADGSRRPAYAAVQQAIRRGCRGARVRWRHTTRVVGGRALFALPRRPLTAVRAGWGFRVTAGEEAAYRAVLFRIAGPVPRAQIVRSLARAAAPGVVATARGRVRPGWKPVIRFPRGRIRAGSYVFAVRLSAAMNPRRTSVFLSRPFRVRG